MLFPLYQRLRNSAPIRRAPVPPKPWTLPTWKRERSHRVSLDAQGMEMGRAGWDSGPTLFCAMAGLSSPSAMREALARNSGRPRMGRYSWFRLPSPAISCSTFLTTGRTHGCPSSVRYAEGRAGATDTGHDLRHACTRVTFRVALSPPALDAAAGPAPWGKALLRLPPGPGTGPRREEGGLGLTAHTQVDLSRVAVLPEVRRQLEDGDGRSAGHSGEDGGGHGGAGAARCVTTAARLLEETLTFSGGAGPRSTSANQRGAATAASYISANQRRPSGRVAMAPIGWRRRSSTHSRVVAAGTVPARVDARSGECPRVRCGAVRYGTVRYGTVPRAQRGPSAALPCHPVCRRLPAAAPLSPRATVANCGDSRSLLPRVRRGAFGPGQPLRRWQRAANPSADVLGRGMLRAAGPRLCRAGTAEGRAAPRIPGLCRSAGSPARLRRKLGGNLRSLGKSSRQTGRASPTAAPQVRLEDAHRPP